MQFVSAAFSLLETALFFGFLIFVALMLLSIILTAGVGILAVYFIQKLDLKLVVPQSTKWPVYTDTIVVEFEMNGASYGGVLQYSFTEEQYLGIDWIDTGSGSDVKTLLDPLEIDRLSDIAEQEWRSNFNADA